MVAPAAAAVALAGVVSGGEGPLGSAWSVVSGPGEVNFADTSSAETTATFFRAGDYVLPLFSTAGEPASPSALLPPPFANVVTSSAVRFAGVTD